MSQKCKGTSKFTASFDLKDHETTGIGDRNACAKQRIRNQSIQQAAMKAKKSHGEMLSLGERDARL